MHYIVDQQQLKYALLRTLRRELYTVLADHSEDNGTILVQKDQLTYSIHLIGFAKAKALRASDFNEGLTKAIELNHPDIAASVLALPMEYAQGAQLRLEAHFSKFNWPQVRDKTADTQLWYVSQPPPPPNILRLLREPIQKLSLKKWLAERPPLPDEKVCANCRHSRLMKWIGVVCSNLKNQEEEWAAKRKIKNATTLVGTRFSCENFEKK